MVQTSPTCSRRLLAQDDNGPYGQIEDLKLESARPENFGIGGPPATRAPAEASRESNDAGEGARATSVEENPLACMMRFNIPGLRRAGRRAGEAS